MLDTIQIRDVRPDDLEPLIALENSAFRSDRLSRRSFLRWIKGKHSIFRVVTNADTLVGYGLVLLHRGTRLARAYSLAIAPEARGCGLGRRLMLDLETHAMNEERFFMRLEVSKQNVSAIKLYQDLGYSVFDEIEGYYEDDSDALRMQKRIRFPENVLIEDRVPWYAQTTEFTCGPASLMMAMAAVRPEHTLTQTLELDLWREATTIYMTSGHGGCHPLGLALAANRRGYSTEVYLSKPNPLFLEGVRAKHKKEILKTVHKQFIEKANKAVIPIHYEAVSIAKIESWLQSGMYVLIMISSYRMNGDKAPHWVIVTASDELCFYIHDPDVEKLTRTQIDCQHIPIAKDEFGKMITYGSHRFSTAVLVKA